MPKGKFKARQAAKLQSKKADAAPKSADKENPAAEASGKAATATATPAAGTPPVPPTAAGAADASTTTVAPPAAPAGGAGGAGAPSGGAGGSGDGSSGKGYVDFDASESGKDLDPKQVVEELVKGITVTTGTNEKKVHPNAKDIQITNLNLSLFGTELLVDTEFTLNWGNRYGLLGPNGCGKSTLMHTVGRRMVPVPKNIDIYHVSGEIEPGDLSALEAVMEVDSERNELEAEAADLEEKLDDPDNGDAYQERVCEIYERLEEMGADTAEARASTILHGLGFTPAMQAKKTREFSGGWRMRISLARALFLNPSCLLLDEPTNHLDMEAVVWLEGYLAKFDKILLLVSHSQDFLNNVTTHTIHMTEQTLNYYGGNYDSYRATRAEKEEAQMKRYEWEQEQIRHMKEYIARFGHGSAKLAKQAQSKEKTLAKMERGGLVQKVKSEKVVTMKFPDPGPLPPPVLQVQNLNFKYPGTDTWIYKDLEFGMDLDSRVALVGPNGAGKTTLLKLITGELVPNSGNVRPHQHLRFQRYTQHFVDSLDLSMTPLEYLMHLYDDESREKCRSYLGRYGVAGAVQTQKMAYLSDGIKSRVVFALIAKKTPHMLLLDEPTNHLDIESIDSLADGIKEFKGGLLLVSHDMRLISQVATEIWECANGTITPFKGTIEDYKKLLQEKLARVAHELKKKEAAAAAAGKA